MTNEADKPSVEGLRALVFDCDKSLSSLRAIRAYAERLASAAAPAAQPATPLREVLSDERIKALAELHGATYIREGGLRSGYGFSSDEVIAFARALMGRKHER